MAAAKNLPLFQRFLRHPVVLNVLIALGILLVLMLMVQWGLQAYTKHGQSVTVPDLTGMTMDKAEAALDKLGLQYQVIDSSFNSDKKPGAVLDQTPKANSKVKEFRMVYLTVNSSNPPSTEIPDLIGKSSLKYAKMQLESYGLKVGEIIYKPDPHLNALIDLKVNGASVTKNMRVAKGTVVDLVLGDGLGGGKIAVPYLLGLRYADAEFKLKGYSLNIGALVVADGVTDTAGAVIYKQIPEYGEGKTIKIGETIDLFIAKELPAGMQVDPSLYNKGSSPADSTQTP